MSDHNDMVVIGLETALYIAGETITYHREAQAIELDAIRGTDQIEDETQTREPAQPRQHLIDWRLQLADLRSEARNTEWRGK